MINEAGLIDLWEEWRASPKFAHLQTEGIRLVPGIGSNSPKAMVIGEAPGAQENEKGAPFVGPCRVIHQLMDAAGMYAYDVAIRGSEGHPETAGVVPANVWLTNTIKFRPPGNRTPNIREILDAMPLLRKEWRLIGRPKLIVAVGSVAAAATGLVGPIPHRGELYPMRDRVSYIAYQYHPAYGLRGDDRRKEMIERQWETMGELIDEMREELDWDD